jgi:hypothetical protein
MSIQVQNTALAAVSEKVIVSQLLVAARTLFSFGLSFGIVGSIWGFLAHKFFQIGDTWLLPTSVATVSGVLFGLCVMGSAVVPYSFRLMKDWYAKKSQTLTCLFGSAISVNPGGNYEGLLLDAGDSTLVLSGGWWLPSNELHFPYIQWGGMGRPLFPSTCLQVTRLPNSGVILSVDTAGTQLPVYGTETYELLMTQLGIVNSAVYSTNWKSLVTVPTRPLPNGEKRVPFCYHGTDNEVRVGDRILTRPVLRSPRAGRVIYVPGQSADDSEFGERLWAYQHDDDGSICAGDYTPQKFSPGKRIMLVSRSE